MWSKHPWLAGTVTILIALVAIALTLKLIDWYRIKRDPEYAAWRAWQREEDEDAWGIIVSFLLFGWLLAAETVSTVHNRTMRFASLGTLFARRPQTYSHGEKSGNGEGAEYTVYRPIGWVATLVFREGQWTLGEHLGSCPGEVYQEALAYASRKYPKG